MTTTIYLVWGIVALLVFVVLFAWGGITSLKMNAAEKAIFCLLLAAVWPAALCLIVVGLPLYPLHRLIEKRKALKKPAPEPDEDDDEPQGFDYEEHEDWTDGNAEYED